MAILKITPKYRIVEVKNLNGNYLYYVEKKTFLWWSKVVKTHTFYDQTWDELVMFKSLDLAQNYIDVKLNEYRDNTWSITKIMNYG